MKQDGRTQRRLKKMARRMILRSGFTGEIEWCDDPIHPRFVHAYAWLSQRDGHFAEVFLGTRAVSVSTVVGSRAVMMEQRIRRRELSHALALWLVDVKSGSPSDGSSP